MVEVTTTPHADVVVLVGGLDSTTIDVLAAARAGSRSPEGPVWVVLIEEGGDADAVVAAGARGCLVVSSTPLQIGAAIRAAARGGYADPGSPVTGPLLQRTPRSARPLTQRETEVLRLVGAGLGNREVAERLYLSLSSVKSHLSHTYGRLGVSGRDAAVAEARRQGLI